jgi:TonB family protein
VNVAPAGHIVNPKAMRLQGEQVNRLRLRRGDEPEKYYPPKAKAERVDGLVTVDLLLNEAGQVLEAQVIHESPEGEGFGLAALDAAKTYEYENPFGRWVLIAITIQFLP